MKAGIPSPESGRPGLNERIDALDGLRAFAFAGVFLVHLGWRVPNGGLGVNVFFTLSGFLITGILLTERERTSRIDLPRFYARRGLRLMPTLLAVVLVSAVYAELLRHAQVLKHETLHGVVPVLLYYSNWTRAFDGHIGMLAHTWSLAVEEQFYLVWPPMLLIAYRVGGRRGVLVLALVGAAASLTLRFALWDGLQSQARVYNGSDTSADQILIGCALAVTTVQYGHAICRVARLLTWPAVFGLLAVALSSAGGRSLFTWGYTLISVAAAVLIARLVTDPRAFLSRALSWRPFAFTGRISYGLYLWHYPIIFIVGDRVPTLAGRTIVVTVIVFVAAISSFKLIEQPALGLRTRLARAPRFEEAGELQRVLS